MNPKTIPSVILPILISLLLLAAPSSPAQDTPATEVQAPPPPPPPPLQTRPPMRPRTIDTPETTLDAKVVLVPLQSLDYAVLGSFATPLGVSVYPDASGENVLLAGSEEALAKVQEFIRLFNTHSSPDKNILLTFHIVTTGQFSQNANPQASPALLEEITKRLDPALGISQCALWDTLYLRVRENDAAELSGFLPTPAQGTENNPGPAAFQVKIGNIAITTQEGSPDTIALDQLMWGGEIGLSANTTPGNQPRPGFRQTVGFQSNLNIPEGALEILCKTSISPQGDSVIILLSAQVLHD